MFDSSVARLVMPGEKFWSDAARIIIPEGHYLAFSWTVTTSSSGVSFPYNTENPLVSAYDAPGFAAGQIIAEVLSQEAPRDNLLIPEYMSSDFDAHPNGEAGAAVASAFLAWYGMGAS
ncbi:hypothetical protein [Paenibacillus harenae]|uniref:Uncharacterized protein n=1 Tax=Paenibacillus harenae TaxID=306543 RepID=A0ABT9TTA8_PAEHA|nr:hypothetical protein [Paenibacillus harenae]MDQ0110586.1 hypothetical protein [Paenibacillus harenae]